MSKGSRPRPYSVSQEQFANSFELIFGKKNSMSPSVEQMKKGTCGCGRSPTGNCIGWHALSEDMYRHKKMLWLEEEFRNDKELNEVKDSSQGG
jgi:hypothetical protein